MKDVKRNKTKFGSSDCELNCERCNKELTSDEYDGSDPDEFVIICKKCLKKCSEDVVEK